MNGAVASRRLLIAAVCGVTLWPLPERVRMLESASDEELRELVRALEGRRGRVNAWLDTFDLERPMSDEAAALMYMLLGLEEMGL